MIFNITVRKQNLTAEKIILPTNSIETINCIIDFDSEWSEYTKTVVFANEAADGTITAVQKLYQTSGCAVPQECLKPGKLFLSVIGLKDNGAKQLSTYQQQGTLVAYGGPITGSEETDYTPALWQQVISALEADKQAAATSAAEAANSAKEASKTLKDAVSAIGYTCEVLDVSDIPQGNDTCVIDSISPETLNGVLNNLNNNKHLLVLKITNNGDDLLAMASKVRTGDNSLEFTCLLFGKIRNYSIFVDDADSQLYGGYVIEKSEGVLRVDAADGELNYSYDEIKHSPQRNSFMLCGIARYSFLSTERMITAISWIFIIHGFLAVVFLLAG